MKSIDASHYLIDLSLIEDTKPTDFPFNLSIFQSLDKIVFHPKVTYIVGENGTGKSTLLEAIAVASGMSPTGGGRNFHHLEDALDSDLHKYLVINRGVNKPKDDFFLNAESLYSLASRIDETFEGSFENYGGKSLHAQSHGESLLSIISKRFRGNGLYLLDEPEAALSPASQFKFLALLHQLVTEKSSQLIIATHSPIIMGYPDSKIYMIENDKLRETDYEATPHYQLTKYFLANRERVLDEIIGKD